jgi:hypothetical protein
MFLTIPIPILEYIILNSSAANFIMLGQKQEPNPPPRISPDVVRISTSISTAPVADEADRLAPFNPTCEQAQSKAIDLLALDSDDVLFDLGCGDARLLVAAAQQIQGLRCIGIDMDPMFVQRAIESVRVLPATVAQRIHIRHENLMDPQTTTTTATHRLVFENDDNIGRETTCRNLTLQEDATAIYLYLLPNGLVRIKPLLDVIIQRRRLQRKRLRVVTYMFRMNGWDPAMVDDSTKGNVRLHLYKFES